MYIQNPHTSSLLTDAILTRCVMKLYCNPVLFKDKEGKAIPLQSWTVPEGSRRMRFPDFKTNQHMKVVRLSALRTGRLYPLGIIPGTHFCWRLSQPQCHIAAGKVMSMKNSNNTIGNLTRDLSAYSSVPPPTGPPCVPKDKDSILKLIGELASANNVHLTRGT